MVFMAGWGVKNGYTQASNVTSSMTATSSNTQGTVVRDSAVILLEGKISSAGKLAFLNNLVALIETDVDTEGNFTEKIWEWK